MQRRMRSDRLDTASLLLAVLLLSGCGFYPRGSITSLIDIGSIYLDTSRSLTIAEAVGDALLESSFTLAPNRDEADILLRLTDEEQRERVVSVRSTGRISELELSHAVSMLIAESTDGQAPAYTPGQSLNRIEVRREYTSDETGVLGKQNEARILRSVMENELVRQIVLRTIASLAPSVSELPIDYSQRRVAALDRIQIGHYLLD